MTKTALLTLMALLAGTSVSMADYTLTFNNRTTTHTGAMNVDSLSLAVTTSVSSVESGIGAVNNALALSGTGTVNDEFVLDLEFGFGFDSTSPSYSTADFSNPTNNTYVFRASGLSPKGAGNKFSANEMLSFTVSGLEDGQSLVLKAYELTDNSPGRTDFYYGAALNKIATTSYLMDVSSYNITLGNEEQFGLGHNFTGTGHRAELVSLTFDVIPEPATLGLVAALGGTILFVRRRVGM